MKWRNVVGYNGLYEVLKEYIYLGKRKSAGGYIWHYLSE